MANESQRRDKLETLRQIMFDEGIDPSELMAAIGSPGKVKKTRSPRPAKYRYTDETEFWMFVASVLSVMTPVRDEFSGKRILLCGSFK
ncbi:TPA: H-NS histone family protein [Klebsiella variicola]|nr:H-NS histone family protein [Klebsiella variicola]HBR8102032.1 H-NS histone family protein [Klebsiella variicola subsp. variicola]ELA2827920.1 H-NS histone family protein [Klebsiella variicola]EMA4735083.1 H-NS histone family protein [Klebsiella variicola]MBC4424414.1 H-NS histone family protein [Klebsiella variicola]